MSARDGRDWPDPTRAAEARHDLDDVLRRALHAAVDSVEPAGDGLTRILHRLTTPSAMRQAALLVTEFAHLAQLIIIWLEPAFTGALRLGQRHRAGYRRAFPHQAARAPLRPARHWLRPALALASAAAIVVIAVVVLGPVRQIVTRTSLNASTGASTPAHAGAHSAGGGHEPSPTINTTSTVPARPGTTSAQAGRASHRPGTAPAPSPAVTPSGSPTAGPSQSPGPTPTPSKTKHGHHKPHPRKKKTPHPGKSHTAVRDQAARAPGSPPGLMVNLT